MMMYVSGPRRSPLNVSVDAPDSGNYTCTASNAFFERGTARTIQLIVHCKINQLLTGPPLNFTSCNFPLLISKPLTLTF